MSKITDLLEQKIKELKGQLHDERTLTYIGQTQCVYFLDGEMHIQYDDDKRLVMDTEQLYKDLPYIIEQTCKEQKKMQEAYLEEIKQSIEAL